MHAFSASPAMLSIDPTTLEPSIDVDEANDLESGNRTNKCGRISARGCVDGIFGGVWALGFGLAGHMFRTIGRTPTVSGLDAHVSSSREECLTLRF